MTGKIALSLALLLTVVALVAIPTAALAINATADAVTVTPNHLYGDPALLDGLTLEANTTLNDYLFWQTTYTPATEETATAYTHYNLRHTAHNPVINYGVVLENGFHHGYSLGGYNLGDGNATGLLKAYNDLYASCPPGETRKMTVNLADLYTYYPITGRISLPGHERHLIDWEDVRIDYTPTPDSRLYVGWRINQYFKIPLVGDEQLEISIDRSRDGHSVGIGSQSVSAVKRDYFVNTYSTIAADICYFTLTCQTGDGTPIDVSQIEGGYGIYALPTGGDRIPIDSLRNAYPLDPAEGDPIGLYAAEDGAALLLYRRNADQITLTVIDRNTMTERQHLTVANAGGTSPVALYEGDGFHVLTLGYARILLVDTDGAGNYRVSLSAAVDEATLAGLDDGLTAALRYQYPTQTMAWDGERLIIADRMSQTQSTVLPAEAADFYLAILTEDGLAYLGLYETSLTNPTDIRHSGREPWPADLDPLILRWN